MKGLITLKIKNFKDDTIAAIDSKLNEMRALLTKYSEQRKFREYGQALDNKIFVNMKDGVDYNEFNQAYVEYKQIQTKRDEGIKDQRNIEMQRYLER